MEDLRKLPSLTVDQKDLINRFYSQFNFSPPGINRHIANVQELHYQGAIAGSEFLIYAATKLYVCFDIIFGIQAIASAAWKRVDIYDENNAANFYGQNQSITYNPIAVAIFYSCNDILIKNLYFSRILVTQYNYVKFNGYRITLD